MNPTTQSKLESMVVHDNICVVNGYFLVKNLDVSTSGMSVESNSLIDMLYLKDATTINSLQGLQHLDSPYCSSMTVPNSFTSKKQ